MLVVIDESGDPGFKLTKGSTPYFVIAMVVFETFAHAEQTSKCIAKARERLRVKREFKFGGSCANVKDGFFSAVGECQFSVRAMIVNKSRIHSDHLRDNTASFYNFCIRQLLHNDGGTLQGANIKIDGCGDREFKRELNAYLRRQVRAEKIAKISFVNSSGDSLIQLADMCAGAVAKGTRMDGKQDDRWLGQLRRAGQVQDLWTFK